MADAHRDALLIEHLPHIVGMQQPEETTPALPTVDHRLRPDDGETVDLMQAVGAYDVMARSCAAAASMPSSDR